MAVSLLATQLFHHSIGVEDTLPSKMVTSLHNFHRDLLYKSHGENKAVDYSVLDDQIYHGMI